MRALLRRVSHLVRHRQAQAELADELDFHRALKERELEQRGYPRVDAVRRTRRALGSVALAQDQSRDVWYPRWIQDRVSDLRHAGRTMRRNPGSTAVVILTLSIGIGANTAVFSVISAVLLRPLPYPDASRLVVFVNTTPQEIRPYASPPNFNAWRQQTNAFEDVSAYTVSVVNLTEGEPEQLTAAQVSAGFLRLFGAAVMVGHPFTIADDQPHAGTSVILSDGFWRRRFGGNPTVVGRTLSINGEPHEVIGILGHFDTAVVQSMTGAPDIWLPLQLDPSSTMHAHYLTVAARLKAGLTLAAANADLRHVAASFRATYPNDMGPADGFGVEFLHARIVGDIARSLWLLLAAVGSVLLIACANVANLLLASATVRQHELAIRMALGATRGRLLLQLLTESTLLSIVGGLLGLLVGIVGLRALVSMNPADIPRLDAGVHIDGRVFSFTAVVSLLAGLATGLVPALSLGHRDLSGSIQDNRGRSTDGVRHRRMHAGLVVTEISCALVLLVSGALFIRTLMALRAVDPGIEIHRVLTARASLRGDAFAHTSAVSALASRGVEALKALPGVEVAAAAWGLPLETPSGFLFIIDGRPLVDVAHGGGGLTPVSPTYFRAFGIPLRRGRLFTDRDVSGSPHVVIINEAMARHYWPSSDPLVDRLTIGRGMGADMELVGHQIIGVVEDVRDMSLDQEPRPIMYVPIAQVPDALGAMILKLTPLAWIVRTRSAPSVLMATDTQRALRSATGLPVARPRTMDDVVERSTARVQFRMRLWAAFGASALLLAAIGVYGVMTYTVEQRTQEVGIRLALGASSGAVRRMIVRQGMGAVGLGLAAGLIVAYGLTRLLAAFLFGVTAHDPVVFVSVPVLLSGVAFLGVWLPARRASRLNPAITLRAG